MSYDARTTVALAMLAAIAAPGCKGSGEGAGQGPPPPQTALSDGDAGVAPIDSGITTLPTYDPRDGFYLDPDTAAPAAPDRNARRDRPLVTLLLRSTPVGALASVEGKRLGPTPILWEGSGGRSLEVTFTLPGHALARYKFVPIVSGVVHGTLVRIASTATKPPTAPLPPPPPPPPSESSPPPAPPIDAAPPVDAAEPIDAAVADPVTPPVGPTP